MTIQISTNEGTEKREGIRTKGTRLVDRIFCGGGGKKTDPLRAKVKWGRRYFGGDRSWRKLPKYKVSI